MFFCSIFCFLNLGGTFFDSYLCWTTVGNYLPTWYVSESWKVMEGQRCRFVTVFLDVCHGCQVSRSMCLDSNILQTCRFPYKGFRTKAAFSSICMRLCVGCLLLIFFVDIYRNGLWCKGIPHPQETSSKLCTCPNSPTSSNRGMQPAGLIIASVVLPAYFAYKILIFLVKQL